MGADLEKSILRGHPGVEALKEHALTLARDLQQEQALELAEHR